MSIAHTADTSGQPISLMADSASEPDRAVYGAHRDWNRRQTAKASRFWSQRDSFCGDLSAEKPCRSRAFLVSCGAFVAKLW